MGAFDNIKPISAAELVNWTPSPEYIARRELATKLTEEAKQLDAPPKYHCTNRVRMLGEKLSRPILCKGRQWAVTRYGIECRDGCYVIAKDRYDEDEPDYSWVQHLAGKDWVDLPDFAEALRIARRIRDGRKD